MENDEARLERAKQLAFSALSHRPEDTPDTLWDSLTPAHQKLILDTIN